MVCKMCGTELADEAKFCSACGSAVEVVEETPAVRTEVAAEQEEVKSVGETQEEIATASAVVRPLAAPVLSVEQKKEKRKRLCALIEGIGLMTGVFFSLLFVFFIGIEAFGAKLNIFHFFADSWKAFGEIKGAGLANASRVAVFFYDFIGLVISIASLFGVICFAVRATIKYVRVWTKKEENRSQKDAMICIFCFLVGSALFAAHNYAATTVMGFKIGTELNGVTVAGIVLAILAVLIKLICSYVAKDKGFFNRDRLIKLAFVAGTALLLTVVIGIAQDTVIAIELSQEGYKTLMEVSPFQFVEYIVGNFHPIYYNPSVPNYKKVKAMAFRLDIYSIVVSLAILAFILLAFYALWKKLKAEDGEEKINKRLSIILTTLSVIMLVFSILYCNVVKKMYDTADSGYSISGQYGRPILCLLFSLLLLASDIARPRLMKYIIKEEKKAEVAVADSEATPTESTEQVENAQENGGEQKKNEL